MAEGSEAFTLAASGDSSLHCCVTLSKGQRLSLGLSYLAGGLTEL